MMISEKKMLIDYATNTNALDDNEKLKLILFTIGIKPITYIILKVFPKKPSEALRFEKFLKKAGFIFKKSRPKTFEEITSIKKNEIRWNVKGVWIGYDLFHTKEQQKKFNKYLSLANKGKHNKADVLAGKLYDYPSCCVKDFIKTHNNPKMISKKYTYHEYYKFLHNIDKKFPFVQHTPHSLTCKKTISLNNKYKQVLQKYAKKFLKNFAKKKIYKIPVVVDGSNDVMSEELLTQESTSIWPIKDGHDCIFITMKPIDKRFWLISNLVRPFIERGTVFNAKITMKYDYAEIQLGSIKKQLGELYHERKFPAQR